MNQPPSLDERLRLNHYLNEWGLLVFTERFHLQRGSCCGSDCRHCPYQPRARHGNTRPADHLGAQARELIGGSSA